MRLTLVVLTTLLLPLAGCVDSPAEADSFRLGTTTSMRDSGLLDILIEDFERLHDIDVEYVAVGTGAALELGRNGDVDALIVHAPDQEAKFIEEGFADERVPIARNAFVLLGQHMERFNFEAFTSILEDETCFISRGDNSGTHAKEQAIWRHINQTQGVEMVEDSNGYHPLGTGTSPSARVWERPSTWLMRRTVQRFQTVERLFNSNQRLTSSGQNFLIRSLIIRTPTW